MSVERCDATRGEASCQVVGVHLVGSMFGHLSAVNSVLLHPDRWTLYSASDDRSMREWDLGPLVQSIANGSIESESVEIPSQRFFSLHRDWITSLSWAPVCIDTRLQLLLCSSSDDSSVRLWCPDSKQCVLTVFSQSQHSVRAVSFLPPRDAASIGTLILACTFDCEAWSIRVDGTAMSSSFLRSLPAHTAQLTCVRSVGRYLLTGSEDGTIEVRL
jgi:WD40 repeat protein